MVQTAVPVADVSNSGWSPESGSSLYSQINQLLPGDPDYVASSTSNATDTFVVNLAALGSPSPGAQTLTVRAKLANSSPGLLVVTLLQGSTVIASATFTPTTSFADYELTLTSAQVALITNYADLRLQVHAIKQPTVTGVSPNSGSTAGGTSVSISGSGFTGATAVTFGSTAATSFVVNSDSAITATSPAESAATVHVTVSNAAGTSPTSSADQYTYVPSGPAIRQSNYAVNLSGANSVSWRMETLPGSLLIAFVHTGGTLTTPSGWSIAQTIGNIGQYHISNAPAQSGSVQANSSGGGFIMLQEVTGLDSAGTIDRTGTSDDTGSDSYWSVYPETRYTPEYWAALVWTTETVSFSNPQYGYEMLESQDFEDTSICVLGQFATHAPSSATGACEIYPEATFNSLVVAYY